MSAEPTVQERVDGTTIAALFRNVLVKYFTRKCGSAADLGEIMSTSTPAPVSDNS